MNRTMFLSQKKQITVINDEDSDEQEQVMRAQDVQQLDVEQQIQQIANAGNKLEYVKQWRLLRDKCNDESINIAMRTQIFRFLEQELAEIDRVVVSQSNFSLSAMLELSDVNQFREQLFFLQSMQIQDYSELFWALTRDSFYVSDPDVQNEYYDILQLVLAFSLLNLNQPAFKYSIFLLNNICALCTSYENSLVYKTLSQIQVQSCLVYKALCKLFVRFTFEVDLEQFTNVQFQPNFSADRSFARLLQSQYDRKFWIKEINQFVTNTLNNVQLPLPKNKILLYIELMDDMCNRSNQKSIAVLELLQVDSVLKTIAQSKDTDVITAYLKVLDHMMVARNMCIFNPESVKYITDLSLSINDTLVSAALGFISYFAEFNVITVDEQLILSIDTQLMRMDEEKFRENYYSLKVIAEKGNYQTELQANKRAVDLGMENGLNEE
ncbi:Hypothetical_protein [Hexamita inflata]|uniref:Hypothetical_protein n=1 Tax=Hexamita inflata TaxID=28002 RepID=A0AA86N7M9_9EUKA|nr:Hypothetical protein HINF_LOCUS1960 [Hexamita inflata]CAI9934657.1 Hypothetical protein HINF_LOCUS22302 [Hexamita inflata]